MKEIQTSDMLNDSEPKSIHHCLEANGLARIMRQVNMISAADQAVQSLLPTDVAKHCHVVTITEQTLVIAADNAAWATRLRYAAPNLLEGFRQLKLPFTVQSIKCRVG